MCTLTEITEEGVALPDLTMGALSHKHRSKIVEPKFGTIIFSLTPSVVLQNLSDPFFYAVSSIKMYISIVVNKIS